MNSRPLVSSVIIFLNAEKFIEEAIESVLVQTYDNWELLLVDDGSTDGSTQIALRYAERHPDKVRYLDHPEHQNRGMSASRNLGISQAKGEYIALLDSDDVWLPHKLEQQVTILESHPEASMVRGLSQYWYGWTGDPEDNRRDFVPELGVEADKLYKPPTLLSLLHPLGDADAPCPSDLLFRRKVVDRIGGFEEAFKGIHQMYEDQAFLAKMYLKEPVFVASECWDRYRRHPEQWVMTMRREGQHHAARLFYFNWLAEYLYEQGFQDIVVWKRLQEVQFQTHSKQLAKLKRELKKHERTGRRGMSSYAGARVKQAIRKMVVLSREYAQRLIILIRRPAQKKKPQAHQEQLEKPKSGLPRERRREVRQLKRQERRLEKRRKLRPPVGKVSFGDLRRLRPISRRYGFDRGKPIDRHYIENFLARHADDVRGRVLEIADNSYTRRYGGSRVKVSDVLHVTEGNPQATIVADLTRAEHIPSDTFDCIIFTQTLHFIYDVRSAIRTLYRILKPGGVLLATFPGISQIQKGYKDGDWHWAFTTQSAKRLFEESFPKYDVEVEAHGNVLVAISFLHGLAVEELEQEELDYRDPDDPDYEVLITLRAVKPEFGRGAPAGNG